MNNFQHRVSTARTRRVVDESETEIGSESDADDRRVAHAGKTECARIGVGGEFEADSSS